jgi:hypothetical protein
MNNFHSENCKKLFKITSEYLAGNISAEEAKKEYSKCDLSYKNKLNKSIVNSINEVNRLAKKKAKEEINVEEESSN